MADVRWHSRMSDIADRLHNAAAEVEDITEGADLDKIEESLVSVEEAIQAAEAAEEEEDDEEDDQEEEADEEDDEDED